MKRFGDEIRVGDGDVGNTSPDLVVVDGGKGQYPESLKDARKGQNRIRQHNQEIETKEREWLKQRGLE